LLWRGSIQTKVPSIPKVQAQLQILVFLDLSIISSCIDMLPSSELAVMARDRRHVMKLMMPTFSGSIDKYGKETVPPLPLSFDKVMEGRPPSTPAPLFGLPDEILTIIVQYVDHESLRSLALVNSDCRQWA
jgi:hypothetical protein